MTARHQVVVYSPHPANPFWYQRAFCAKDDCDWTWDGIGSLPFYREQHEALNDMPHPSPDQSTKDNAMPSIPLGHLGKDNTFTKADHAGHVLLFVQPAREQLETAFGDQEAAHCSYVVCGSCQAGWPDVIIFGSYLVPRICSGDPLVAGTLVRGEAQPGRQAPWLLDDLGDDDRQITQALADKVVTRLGSGRLVVDLDALPGQGLPARYTHNPEEPF